MTEINFCTVQKVVRVEVRYSIPSENPKLLLRNVKGFIEEMRRELFNRGIIPLDSPIPIYIIGYHCGFYSEPHFNELKRWFENQPETSSYMVTF